MKDSDFLLLLADEYREDVCYSASVGKCRTCKKLIQWFGLIYCDQCKEQRLREIARRLDV